MNVLTEKQRLLYELNNITRKVILGDYDNDEYLKQEIKVDIENIFTIIKYEKPCLLCGDLQSHDFVCTKNHCGIPQPSRIGDSCWTPPKKENIDG